jgi:hypothetical protein
MPENAGWPNNQSPLDEPNALTSACLSMTSDPLPARGLASIHEEEKMGPKLKCCCLKYEEKFNFSDSGTR